MGVKNKLQFGELAPDSSDFDNPSLEKLENGLPVYGGYRGVRSSEQRAVEELASNFVTGAYAHLISADFDVQRAVPDETLTEGDFYANIGEPLYTKDETWTTVSNLTFDDTTRTLWRHEDENDTADQHEWGLTDVDDPGVDTGHKLAVRYRGYIDEGTGTMNLTLHDDNISYDIIKSGETWTGEITSGDADYANGQWLYKEIPIANTDIANWKAEGGWSTVGYQNLQLKVDAAITGMDAGENDLLISYPSADEDNSDGFMNKDDTTTDIYLSIDDIKADGDSADDDDTYIKTPLMIDASTKKYRCKLSDLRSIGVAGIVGDPTTITWRVKSSVAAGMDIKKSLWFKDRLIEHAWDYDIGTSWADSSITLSTAGFAAELRATYYGPEWLEAYEEDDDPFGPSSDNIIADIMDYLYAEIEFVYDGAAASDRETEPGADSTPKEWQDNGGDNSDLYLDIQESSGTSPYVTSIEATSPSKYRFSFTAVSEPDNHTDTKIRVKARKDTSRITDLKMTLYWEGSSNKISKTFSELTDSWVEYTWNIPESVSEGLDWDDVILCQVEQPKDSAYTREIHVAYVTLDSTSAGETGYMTANYASFPGGQGFDISLAQLIVPTLNSEQIGDQVKLVAGTQHKLWHVEEGQFNDVSRTVADEDDDTLHGQKTSSPQIWDFCSWGGNIIAASYGEELQTWDLEAGNVKFTKLTNEADATEYSPRAKYCDIVGTHLVVANIDTAYDGAGTPAEYTGAYNYTVWWSANEDPQKFRIGDYSGLSDLQHLRQTPGEITGFLGGEYGTIFKRDSIYRMSWVGGNLVFRFDVLARGVGTSHPASIVSKDADIYFYGHNDFYIMQGGGKPQPMGVGKIKSLLLESFWEERALNREQYDTQLENDLRIVGAYDQFSGLIFWTVDNNQANSGYSQKSDILVYNPVLNTWGYIRDSRYSDVATRGISYICTSPSAPQDNNYYLNNLNVFAHDSASTTKFTLDKFVSASFLPMTLETNTVSAAALGVEDADLISLQSVRPFYSRIAQMDNLSDSNGSVLDLPYTTTIYSSYDPLMVDDVTSVTANGPGSSNRNGWTALSKILSGEFWKFKFSFPKYYATGEPSTYGVVKNFMGLQLDYNKEGDR